MNQLTCRECWIQFQSRRRDARYCSCACRQRAHRSASRIPMSDAGSVGAAARDKLIAVTEPATGTTEAALSVTGKERARWRQRMVWPDFIG